MATHHASYKINHIKIYLKQKKYTFSSTTFECIQSSEGFFFSQIIFFRGVGGNCQLTIIWAAIID